MDKQYIAHINEHTEEIQTVKEHSENTALLCRRFAISQLKDFMYVTGLYHDAGKFQPSFQKRIKGANIRVEHSTCGALAVKERYEKDKMDSIMTLMMEYCIAGHHSGLPDGGISAQNPDDITLRDRMARTFEDFSAYKSELPCPEVDTKAWLTYMAGDCQRTADARRNAEYWIDKFSFFTRYAFSCLVDADSQDTAQFCRERERPRAMQGSFVRCLEKVNKKITSFQCETELQKARALLQAQAFEHAEQKGEIFLLNMPTGSGKTLASVKIALERALKTGKKRIIYVIPYNSIIDQTVNVFETLFGEDMEILRHQSTFSYDDAEEKSEDYREAAKYAAENWDAPFIITTAVQFFETIFANKRSRLRKMHNMSDSILIFDEAHLMPEQYLQPCLQGISFITRYLNSEAVFLTATMPDFSELIGKYALPDSNIVDLICDRTEFEKFKKCRYRYLGEISSETLLEKTKEYPSNLIIVNKKKAARKLYQDCTGKKFHLSTYMTSVDRERVLNQIRKELKNLERDYPDLENVPDNRRITILSTSLIEAGVDLDVYTVFRETAGLDSILQAGGRCNREGRRTAADVYVFDFSDETMKMTVDDRISLTKGSLEAYEDISSAECIEAYYRRLFFMNEEILTEYAMHRQCTDVFSIPFKTYAEYIKIIDSKNMSVVAAGKDEKGRELVEKLRFTKTADARKLQKYTCTVTQSEFNDLLGQGALDDYGTGIYCLTNDDYYDEEVGILFEAKDYFIS